MSAGAAESPLAVNRSLDELAPHFRDAVRDALRCCAEKGLDAYVYETYRSPELQAEYYSRGRTKIPPTYTVTNARSNLYSWHGYGLAVDVISREHGWNPPGRDAWFARVAECFRAAGCRWGGEWKMKDLPHFQWGLCKPSPSDRARLLYAQGGRHAVWEAVGAASGD
ncbi:MAG TPA: M15 family metallopeptidase [Gemmatimonadaceae bacterium]|nr:M15 family metallopeptidase [Gemmatimonadaceae bacterium]